jgi:hypothetical protein
MSGYRIFSVDIQKSSDTINFKFLAKSITEAKQILESLGLTGEPKLLVNLYKND